MLYDPKLEKNSEAKADPFSLESLIAWLEKQPANMGYSYVCNGHCMIAQCLTALGYRNVRIGPAAWRANGVPLTLLPDHFNAIAVGCDDDLFPGCDQGMTFGAALERARAALADRS